MNSLKLHKTPYLIDNMSTDDLHTILKIEGESFGLNGWTHTTYLNELSKHDNAKYFVCKRITKLKIPVGYAGMWNVFNEGHITTIAVDSVYRNKHIADILLYTIIKYSMKLSIRYLTLEVRASNIPALNLYTKYMFKYSGIRKKYYQDNNEDAIILWTGDISNIDYFNLLKGNVSLHLNNFIYADKLQYINN